MRSNQNAPQLYAKSDYLRRDLCWISEKRMWGGEKGGIPISLFEPSSAYFLNDGLGACVVPMDLPSFSRPQGLHLTWGASVMLI